MRLINTDRITPIALDKYFCELDKTDILSSDKVIVEVGYLFKRFVAFINTQQTALDINALKAAIKEESAKSVEPHGLLSPDTVLDIINKYVKE